MQSEALSTFITTKARGVTRLTRWKETVPFTIPVTLVGSLLAFYLTGARPDFRVVVVLAANILAMFYAFMINDVVDAPDDAREAPRAARNPICNGELSPREGWSVALLVAAGALILYALAGLWTFLIGLATLVLSHLYSAKPIRLKALPVVDIISHVLMLSGMLFLAGYFAYDTNPGPAWLVFGAMVLISGYGQLYNHIRDFDMDVQAKLLNTSILLGKRGAMALMYLSVVGAGVLLVVAYFMGVFPRWLPLAALAALPLLYFIRFKTDARGGKAADLSGNVQLQLLMVANAIVFVWLFAVVAGLA